MGRRTGSGRPVPDARCPTPDARRPTPDARRSVLDIKQRAQVTLISLARLHRSLNSLWLAAGALNSMCASGEQLEPLAFLASHLLALLRGVTVRAANADSQQASEKRRVRLIGRRARRARPLSRRQPLAAQLCRRESELYYCKLIVMARPLRLGRPCVAATRPASLAIFRPSSRRWMRRIAGSPAMACDGPTTVRPTAHQTARRHSRGPAAETSRPGVRAQSHS